MDGASIEEDAVGLANVRVTTRRGKSASFEDSVGIEAAEGWRVRTRVVSERGGAAGTTGGTEKTASDVVATGNMGRT